MSASKNEFRQRRSDGSFIERVGLLLNGNVEGQIFKASNSEGIAVKSLPSSITVYVDIDKYCVEGLAKTSAMIASQLKIAEITCSDETTLYNLLNTLQKKNGIEEPIFIQLYETTEHMHQYC